MKPPKDRAKYNAYMRAYMRSWRKGEKTKPVHSAIQTRYRRNLRKRVLSYLCGGKPPACARCGCSVEAILEVNHKNGDGKKERSERSHARIMSSILAEHRLSEFNVLCRLCNAIDGLERQMATFRPDLKYTVTVECSALND